MTTSEDTRRLCKCHSLPMLRAGVRKGNIKWRCRVAHNNAQKRWREQRPEAWVRAYHKYNNSAQGYLAGRRSQIKRKRRQLEHQLDTEAA